MKNLLFLLFLVWGSCDKRNPSQSIRNFNTNVPEMLDISPSMNSPVVKDSMNFNFFLTLFNSISLPCSTQIINDFSYCTVPFDKNIPYLNASNDSLVVKINPKNTVCELFDVCTTFPPFDLNKRYSEPNRFANKLHGTRLWFKTDKFVAILCKSRSMDPDIYLLTYTPSGTLLSSIQTDMRCVNKVADLKRKTYIDKNLNIFITDFQKDNECDKAGFKIKYHYKVDERGKIYKVQETVTILEAIEDQEFKKF